MSERMNNPEKQLPQWFDTCNKCETKYPLTPENTLYVYFEKQEECNYLVCKCPNCGSNTMIFDEDIGPNDALARDIMIDDSDRLASEQIYQTWFQVKGLELPQEYELTPRMEKLVAHFGETISKMSDEAPELFWDEMNSPQPTPYPQRWI